MPVFALPAMRAAIAYTAPSAAAASGWWLSGGISAANCFGAWAAVGAASKAASLLDLNTSGNDLTETGTVTFSAVNGWSGWDNAVYLMCAPIGISGNVARTIIVRANLSTNANESIVGFSNVVVSGGTLQSIAVTEEIGARYNGSNNIFSTSTTGDVVVAFTYDGTTVGSGGGVSMYLNGLPLSQSGSGSSQTLSTTDGVIIGGFVPGSTDESASPILAASVYNNELTAGQVSAVSTAMAAL